MSKHWRVVVVEDNFDDMQVLTTVLEYHALEVQAVSTLSACRVLLSEFKPDVVMTDLAMPNADGWAVLKAIRSDPETFNLPVIAMTAYHSTQLAEKVMQGGFDGYFPKPIDAQTLTANLKAILEDKK